MRVLGRGQFCPKTPYFDLYTVEGDTGANGRPVRRANPPRSAIDTGIGTHLSLRYVDGPYSRLEGEAQRAQALAIARFVWGLPQRPKGTDTIMVRVQRPMRMLGDVWVATEQIFLPAELNGR